MPAEKYCCPIGSHTQTRLEKKKNRPQPPKMAGDPTFSCFLRIYMGGALVVNKLFQSSTDGVRARPDHVLAEKYCFPIGPHRLFPLDKTVRISPK